MEKTAIKVELADKGAAMRKVVRIDPRLCSGCGACVDVCGRGVLAMVKGRAVLVAPRRCDGLGVCAEACPQGAISVVTWSSGRQGDSSPGASAGPGAAADEDISAGSPNEFHERLAICCSASECGRICRRLVKQPGRTGVWCVDIMTGVKISLYEALARPEFQCPEGKF